VKLLPSARTEYGVSFVYHGETKPALLSVQFSGPRPTQPPRSSISTRCPALTSGQAAMTPPKPLPMTIASHVIGGLPVQSAMP